MLTAIIVLITAGALWLVLITRLCRESHQLNRLEETQEKILMKISELTPALTAIESTLTKIQAEVQALKEAAEDADLPAEVVASIDRLSALSAAIDAINPDGTTAPTTPQPPI